MEIIVNRKIDSEEKAIYNDLIALLHDIKVTMGATDLISTLRRHKTLKDFLLRNQKETIFDLEERIEKLGTK